MAASRALVVQAQRAVELAKTDLVAALQLDPRCNYEFAAAPPAVAGVICSPRS